MVVLGLWQLPHFWLLLLIEKDEFQQQNLPHMLQKLTMNQLNRILFVWALSFAAMVMLLPLVKVLTVPWIYWPLAVYLIILILFMGYALLLLKRTHIYKFWFKHLNMIMGLTLSLIIIDKLL